jgi:MFS family permease
VLFIARLMTAAEPFIPLAVMFNPVVATGTAVNFFVMGALVGLSIYTPIYFEAVAGLTASQSGFALIALMGGTVTGAQVAGRIMAWYEHYKRGAVGGLALATVALTVLAATAAWQPLSGFLILLTLTGLGLGTIFPVTTVAIQNAVEPHQLGTTTAAFNFFRSLGSAILVAVFGAILLGMLGVAGQPISSVEMLVADAAARGTPIAPVFGILFAAGALTLAIGFVCLLAMEERPLRAY